MSAVKKDCARSLYNAYVVLYHPERSGLDKNFFFEFMLLMGKIEKSKSKNSLGQKPIEHWIELEHIPSYILQVN